MNRHYPVKMITIILAMVLLGVLRVLQHVHSDPQNQQLIYEYYNSFVKVCNIIKNDDGGFLFRNWQLKFQDA